MIPRYIEYLRDSLLEDPNEVAYQEARSRRMQAAAAQAELDLGRESGQLIRRSNVLREVGSVLIAVKNHMLAIPSRLARQMLGLSDYQTSYQLLDDAVRGALNDLSETNFDEGMAAQRRERDQGKTHGDASGEREAGDG